MFDDELDQIEIEDHEATYQWVHENLQKPAQEEERITSPMFHTENPHLQEDNHCHYLYKNEFDHYLR